MPIYLPLVLLALSTPGHSVQELTKEAAFASAMAFSKQLGGPKDLTVKSFYAIPVENRYGFSVWNMQLTTSDANEISMGFNRRGTVLWFEHTPSNASSGPLEDSAWAVQIQKHARNSLDRLKTKFPVQRSGFDFASYGPDSFAFPILVNGKQVVGEFVGYIFRFRHPDLSLLRFSRNERIPKTNTDSPRISVVQAEAVARASFASDSNKQQNSSEKFDIGEKSLVYYLGAGSNTATLAWYMPVRAVYESSFSSKMAFYGVVVDATTGQRIQTKSQLPVKLPLKL